MKLNYDNLGIETDSGRCFVLLYDSHRVELYIKRRDNDTYTLACFAGPSNLQPNKTKLQGPYHSLDQTKAAVNAILNALKRHNYQASNTTPIWSLQAQAAVNNLNNENAQAEGNYDFDPQDVFFEHNQNTDK